MAQLVGSQSGETIVLTFNCSDLFNKHITKTAFKGVKKINLSHCFPGQMSVKNECDGTVH